MAIRKLRKRLTAVCHRRDARRSDEARVVGTSQARLLSFCPQVRLTRGLRLASDDPGWSLESATLSREPCWDTDDLLQGGPTRSAEQGGPCRMRIRTRPFPPKFQTGVHKFEEPQRPLWRYPSGEMKLLWSDGGNRFRPDLAATSLRILGTMRLPAGVPWCLALLGWVGAGAGLGLNPAQAAEPGPLAPPRPNFAPVGFAHVGAPVTGGGGSESIRVRSVQELQAAAGTDEPRVLLLEGTFELRRQSVRVGSNKTLLGGGEGAVLLGGALYLRNATNVILRNLILRDSPEDGISLSGARRVWVDHCTVMDCGDGLIDLTHGTDEVTISWCRFGYQNLKNSHRLASLLGASDRDRACEGRLRVTYHHNWWDAGCLERMPSVRFGRVHVFNNYYRAPGNRYCIRSRLFAECRIEFNWFEDVRNPWELMVTTGDTGRIFAAGNVEVNTRWENPGGNVRLVSGTDSVFAPPYPWQPDPPQWIPWLVTNHAGAGRGPFAR